MGEPLTPGHPGSYKYINQMCSDRIPFQQVITSLSITEKILTNILQHPDDDKFRRINMTGSTYLRNIQPIPGAQALFIKWLGARILTENFNEYLIIPNTNLPRIQETLDACILKRTRIQQYREDEEQRFRLKRAAEAATKLRVMKQIDWDKQERHANKPKAYQASSNTAMPVLSHSDQFFDLPQEDTDDISEDDTKN